MSDKRDTPINLLAILGLGLIFVGLYALAGWPAVSILGGTVLFIGAGLSAIRK